MTVSSERYHSTHKGCIHPKWSYWRRGHHNATYPQFIQGFAPTDVQGPTRSRRLIFVLFEEQIPLSHQKDVTLTSYMTFLTLTSLPVKQGNNQSQLPGLLGGLHELIKVKHLQKGLEPSQGSKTLALVSGVY